MIVRLLMLFLALVVVQGCTQNSIHIRQPVNRFEIPESQGHLHWSFNPQVSGGYEIKIRTPNAAAPDPNTPEISRFQGNPGFGGLIGLTPYLDLGMFFEQNENSLPGNVSVSKYKVKFQFLGPTMVEAKQGDFSMAVSAAYHYGTNDEQDQYSDEKTWHSIEIQSLDAALVAGVRLTDDTLLYGGPYITHTEFDSRYEYRDSSQRIKTRHNGSSEIIGRHAGLAFFMPRGWNVKTEVSHSRIHWRNSRDRTTHVGVRLTKVMQ